MYMIIYLLLTASYIVYTIVEVSNAISSQKPSSLIIVFTHGECSNDSQEFLRQPLNQIWNTPLHRLVMPHQQNVRNSLPPALSTRAAHGKGNVDKNTRP